MKKRFLPISLLLVIMILGQSVMADQGGHYVPRAKETASAVSELNLMRVNQHTGMIDPAWMIQASQQAAALSSKEDGDLYWRSMGPVNMGGRTTAVLYNNQNPNEVYIGSMGGGVFYTWNKGITWHHVGEELMVSCMAQAEDGTIYVGTGDGGSAVNYNGMADLSYANSFVGTGLYAIKNNKMSRVESTIPSTLSDVDDWSFINDIAVDGNRIIVATNAGVKYLSLANINDPNAVWQTAKDKAGAPITDNAAAVKVTADHKVVASVQGALYIGALDAMALRSQAEIHYNEANMIDSLAVSECILDIAVAPSDANVIYAADVNLDGKHNYIYLSEDQGETWRVILNAVNGDIGHQVYESWGMFNHGLVVAPNNAYSVFVLSYNLWRLDRPANDPQAYYLAIKLTDGNTGSFFLNNYVHVGLNAMAFNPRNNNQVYIGTDGGVFKGQFDASMYMTFENCNRGYISTRCFNVAPTGIVNSVVAGLLDFGPVYLDGVEDQKAVPLFPYNSPSYYGNFDDTCHAGPCAASTIDPLKLFLVCKDGRIVRTETGGVDYDHTNFNANQSFSFTGFRMPIALWESYNYENSVDSVWFKCKQNVGPGDQIQCRSHNSSYPFYSVAIDSMHFNDSMPQFSDSLLVKDPIATKFYVADGSALYYTMMGLVFNKPTEWYKLATLDAAASCITVSADGDMVLVGTRNGKLIRVTNMLAAYDSLTSTPTSDLFAPEVSVIDLNVDGQCVTSAAISNDNKKVVVTLGNYGNANYVLYCNNALAETPNFVAKQGALPAMPVYSSIFEMTTGDVIIGTEHGIYRTTNIEGMPVWVAQGTNVGDVPVMEMKQQTLFQETQYVPMIVDTLVIMTPVEGVHNQGVIYAATYGRGLFRCENYRLNSGSSVPEMPVAETKTSVTMYPNPVRDAAKVSFELNQNSNVSYQVFDLMGRMVGNQNLGNFSEGAHEINVEVSGLSSGSYILRLNAGQNTSSVKFMVY